MQVVGITEKPDLIDFPDFVIEPFPFSRSFVCVSDSSHCPHSMTMTDDEVNTDPRRSRVLKTVACVLAVLIEEVGLAGPHLRSLVPLDETTCDEASENARGT